MPKRLSSNEVAAFLRDNGFGEISQKGSYVKFHKEVDGATHTVIVPAGRKVLPMGTLASIARQVHIPMSDFLER